MAGHLVPLPPYEGSDPYVFVSYSHNNKQEVCDVIAQLQKDGFHVWYDEGVKPGTKWSKNVADHLQNCSYFIAMISGDYLASSNCLDELEFARDAEFPRTLVYLTRTPLPPELKLRHNRNFAVQKYRMSDREFISKLYTAEGLSLCRGSGPQKVRKEHNWAATLTLLVFLAALVFAVWKLQPDLLQRIARAARSFSFRDFWHRLVQMRASL
ncbi:MAG: toll/interleukin-1 receptor domain-containing protein [Oscillospiraceae bacterium]|nr:toll/interleukin-1 receptor domain-containing protein [Oscillospiraceae bacterium]